EVVFGPAGFSVTPQGDVSWSAVGPLFDRDTDFKWGVRVTGVPSAQLTGTIKVTDASREYPLRRTGLSIPVRHSGLRIADLDGDGTREMLVGSRQAVYVLSRSGATYQQSWVYPFDPGVRSDDNSGAGLQAVTSADIDGDGKQEIFFSKTSRLVRLDGVARREAANTELRCRGLELADLDGNGTQELVCLATRSDYPYETDGRIVVVNPRTLAEIWSTPEFSVGSTMAVGNVDNDAALEIVTASGIVLDGATHQIEWTYSQPFGDVVDTGDMDGDGIEEIIGMANFDGVRAYSAVLQSELWQYTPSSWDLDTMVVADANGDGRVEAIVGNGQWGKVMGIGYDTTSQQPELLWEINSQDHGVTSIAVGDVDADGANEVVWGTGESSSGRDDFVIAGFTPAISVKWQSSSMPTITGITYGGALARIGAGATRLMFSAATDFGSDSGVRAIAFTPMTGALEFSNAIGGNGSNSPPLTVVDYDNDGIDELFFGSSHGYFGAYDFAARSIEWQSPRSFADYPLGTQQADMNGDGYSDLVGLTTDGYTEIYDVQAQSLLWRSTQLRGGVALSLSDLDNDEVQDIVLATQDRIVVYGKNAAGTTYVERASVEYSDTIDLVVADLNGDSKQEIYALSAPVWATEATLTVFDADLQQVRSTPLGARASALYVEQSAFARKNLLLAVTRGNNYSAGSELRAIDPVAGTDVWRSPLLVSTVARNSVHFVDVDGDGVYEIAFGTYDGMYQTR
ncbi:MAG TPA: VCBS repeat-containing protein, partial [Steroidobacter sp.]|nr:VCBS repeat-containing protein [Steroidobacter sp.]